jgi:hypothetical protein
LIFSLCLFEAGNSDVDFVVNVFDLGNVDSDTVVCYSSGMRVILIAPSSLVTSAFSSASPSAEDN